MTHTNPSSFQSTKKVFGMIAEFKTPHALLEAVKKVRGLGYRQLDTYTPFPIHGMDKAMGLRPSRLPWLVLCGALFGTISGIVMQAWMNGIDYPFRIGGKPFFSYQAYVPVAFELTVLCGALATVLGMFALNRLPQPYHPLFTHSRFARATDDGFFLAIESSDYHWDERKLYEVLETAGGSSISLVYDQAGGSS